MPRHAILEFRHQSSGRSNPNAELPQSQNVLDKTSKLPLVNLSPDVSNNLAMKIPSVTRREIRSGRNTSPPVLKYESAKRNCELMSMVSRRQKLNEELRERKQRHLSKKLQDVIQKLNSDLWFRRQGQMRFGGSNC
jgi:hypothetical protein